MFLNYIWTPLKTYPFRVNVVIVSIGLCLRNAIIYLGLQLKCLTNEIKIKKSTKNQKSKKNQQKDNCQACSRKRGNRYT